MPTGGRFRVLLLVLLLPVVAVGSGIVAMLTVDPLPVEEELEPAAVTTEAVLEIEQGGLPGSPYRIALDAFRRCLEVSAEPATCGAPPEPQAYSMLGPKSVAEPSSP